MSRVRYEAWKRRIQRKMNMYRGLPFAIGDLLLEGQNKFGEIAIQEITSQGNHPTTFNNWQRIAETFSPEERNLPNLTHGHYIEIAQIFNPDARKEILRQASINAYDTRTLRKIRARLNKEFKSG